MKYIDKNLREIKTGDFVMNSAGVAHGPVKADDDRLRIPQRRQGEYYVLAAETLPKTSWVRCEPPA